MAEEEAGYSWETEYEKTWEALQEDAYGSLQPSIDDVVLRAKRRRLLERPNHVKLGMMRHLFVVVDMSQAMTDQDLKPTRLHSTLKLLEHFVEEYFDQNPISQLGFMITRNKRSERITELGGNPKRHIEALRKLVERPCLGEPSLQNALDLAAQTLRNMPSHASREVLIVFGSLTSCDPGDILQTIQKMQGDRISCSVIGLAAEVRVCKKLCHDTGGQYNVILDEMHFKDLLRHHVSPPQALNNEESSLIKMGFPHQQSEVNHGSMGVPSFCMCHLDNPEKCELSSSGYFCPQCRAKYCELPVECRACGLTLISAPHLARSYHHLFPVAAFSEVRMDDTNSLEKHRCCFSCLKTFQGGLAYECGKCRSCFCVDCDLFVHETLHTCPGCATSRYTQHLL